MRQGLGIAASGIDTLAIFKTTTGKKAKVVKGGVTTLVPPTVTPVGIKFYVQVFYKLKE